MREAGGMANATIIERLLETRRMDIDGISAVVTGGGRCSAPTARSRS